MQADGVRFLERRLESFFTPWAWQWDVGATPEFGSYLGMRASLNALPLSLDLESRSFDSSTQEAIRKLHN